jgi:hypothetical protein
MSNYEFACTSRIHAQVYLLDGYVQSITYGCHSSEYLLKSVPTLLQKNLAGNWTLYDDGRGKTTYATWQYVNNEGVTIAYSLLYNYPDRNGWYRLLVATTDWDRYLAGRGQSSRPADLSSL